MADRSYFIGRAVGRQERVKKLEVPRLDWQGHVDAHLADWEPGQHVSIFGPPGSGKTHLALFGLAPLWRQPGQEYKWLTIDVKGDDPILQGWGHAVTKLPNRWVRSQIYEPHIKDGRTFRLLVTESVDNYDRARKRVVAALKAVRADRQWVVHLNEVKALTDPQKPMLGLRPLMEQHWLRGRPHITIIAETQMPAWVPRSMFDGATHYYFGQVLDQRTRDRVREIAGKSDLMESAMHQLQRHEFAYIHRETGEIAIVQAPPRVQQPRQRGANGVE